MYAGLGTFNIKGLTVASPQIPIRNVIVIINRKPTVEFESVKIVTLPELLGYVKFFEPCLSGKETNKIGDYLVRVGARG